MPGYWSLGSRLKVTGSIHARSITSKMPGYWSLGSLRATGWSAGTAKTEVRDSLSPLAVRMAFILGHGTKRREVPIRVPGKRPGRGKDFQVLAGLGFCPVGGPAFDLGKLQGVLNP
jgi:hypothetical protein